MSKLEHARATGALQAAAKELRDSAAFEPHDAQALRAYALFKLEWLRHHPPRRIAQARFPTNRSCARWPWVSSREKGDGGCGTRSWA